MIKYFTRCLLKRALLALGVVVIFAAIYAIQDPIASIPIMM